MSQHVDAIRKIMAEVQGRRPVSPKLHLKFLQVAVDFGRLTEEQRGATVDLYRLLCEAGEKQRPDTLKKEGGLP